MIFGSDAIIEKKFKYKGIFNCYCIFTDEGYRSCYIEFCLNDFKDENNNPMTHLKAYQIITRNSNVNVSLVEYDRKNNIYCLGCHYLHTTTGLYDIESFKKYFPDIYNNDKRKVNEMLYRNNQRSHREKVATLENAEIDCIKMCETLRKYYVDPDTKYV